MSEFLGLLQAAEEASRLRHQQFLWLPNAGASEWEIEHCESLCGLRLSKCHRSLLRSFNGAELRYTVIDNPSNIIIELLSTSRITSVYKSLSVENDAHVPSHRPADLWGELIPVNDLMDSQFLFCEAVRTVEDEYEVFYGYLESSPGEWRQFPAFAPDVIAALGKMLRVFIVDGVIGDFY